jgi:hypothetical protein
MEEVGRTSYHSERRRYPRFKLSQALAYEWGETGDTVRTVDVSLGGVRIQTDSFIPADERLDLVLLLEYEAIRTVGKIVWSKWSSGGKYDTGISFETISHQCLNRLERFLEEAFLKEMLAKRKKGLDQSAPEGLESESLDSNRLRFSFLRWLHKSYPWDYERYADRSEIGENEMRDFLRNKGFDQVNVDYLLKSLKGGYAAKL